MKGAPSRSIFAYKPDQHGVDEIAKRLARSALAQGDENFITDEGEKSTAQRLPLDQQRAVPGYPSSNGEPTQSVRGVATVMVRRATIDCCE
jgi:hypothetical protein